MEFGFEEGVCFRQSSSFPAVRPVDSWAATVVRCPKTFPAMEHSSKTVEAQKSSHHSHFLQKILWCMGRQKMSKKIEPELKREQSRVQQRVLGRLLPR